jgi:hypothetical protein
MFPLFINMKQILKIFNLKKEGYKSYEKKPDIGIL